MAFGFDPSIILSAKGGPESSFNDTLQTLANLTTHRAQLGDMLRKQQSEQTLADIYRRNAGGLPEGLPRELAAAGMGQQAFGAWDQSAQMAAAKAKAEADFRTGRTAEMKMMGDLFSNVPDQESWGRARQMAPEHYRPFIPEQLDPELGKKFAGFGISAKDRSDIEQKGIDRTIAETKAKEDRAAAEKRVRILAGDRKGAASMAGVDKLRNTIDSNKGVAKYRGAAAELDSLRTLAEGKSGASDMAIVFAFMKAMDPDSVVRESEYASAAKSGTPSERLAAEMGKYWTGEKLSSGQRQAFIKAAEAAQSGHKARYEREVKKYRITADKRGYDLAELGLEDEPSGLTKEEAEELARLEADEAKATGGQK